MFFSKKNSSGRYLALLNLSPMHKQIISLYLSKQGQSLNDLVQKIKTDPERTLADPLRPSNDCAIFISQPVNEEAPDWARYISKELKNDSDKQKVLDLHNHLASALVVVEMSVQSRCMFVAFGGGRNLIPEDVAEDDFGRTVILNSVDDLEDIDSAQATTYSSSPKQTRVQCSLPMKLHELGFDFDEAELKKLSIPLKEQKIVVLGYSKKELSIKFSGAEALQLKTSQPISKLTNLFCWLVQQYDLGDSYKDRFPEIGKVTKIKDEGLISRLDSDLEKSLKQGCFDNVFVNVPFDIDLDQINRYEIKGIENVTSKDSIFDLPAPADIFFTKNNFSVSAGNKDVTVALLKTKAEIVFKDSNRQKLKATSLYKALGFETTIGSGEDKQTFILKEGNWYKVAADLAANVDKLVRDHIDSQPPILRPFDRSMCTKKLTDGKVEVREELYLQEEAKEHGYTYLDQKGIGGRKHIEVCDLHYLNGRSQFIHVKRYGSSAQLGHLFNQGQVSIRSVLGEPALADEYIEKLVESDRDKARDNLRQKNIEVVYAILYEKSFKDPYHLPFFAKLMLYVTLRELKLLGVTPKLQFIPPKSKI